MALIKCNECGKEISENAISCPNCGAKNRNNKETASTGLKVICFLIPLIGIIIFAVNISTRPKYAKQCLIASLLPTIIVGIVIIIFVSGAFITGASKTINDKMVFANEDIEKTRKSLIDDSSISIYKGNKAYQKDGSTYSGNESRIVAVKNDGSVIAIGNADNGICNVSDWKNIKSVSTSSTHTVGLKEDGTVLATGLNTKGQCNVSKWKNIIKIISIRDNTIGLKEDGTIIITGNDKRKYEKVVNNWKNVIDIEVHDDDILGITAEGNVLSAFDIADSSKDYHTDELQSKLSSFNNICKLCYDRDSQILGIKKDKTVITTDSAETSRNIIYIRDNAVHNTYCITNKGAVGYTNNYTTKDMEDIKDWKNLLYVNLYYTDFETEKYYYMGITKDGKILDNGNNQIVNFDSLTDLKIVEDNKYKLY